MKTMNKDTHTKSTFRRTSMAAAVGLPMAGLVFKICPEWGDLYISFLGGFILMGILLNIAHEQDQEETLGK